MSAKKLGGATKELIGVGADLSATFGGTTTDAVGALSSAFKGEFDSLEKYGISLKESTISAELAARGQDKLTGAALAAAKQQVTTDLIMKQSSKSRGAFAKESNTLAHQQQVLGAQFTNLKATLGTALLPVITKVLTVINDAFVPAIAAIGTFIAPVVARVREFFSGLGGGESVMSRIMPVLQTMANTFMNVILPALSSVASYIIGKVVPVFTQVSDIIQTKVIPIFVSVATFIYGTLVPAVVAIVQKVGGNLKPVFDTLVATFQSKVLPAISKLLSKFQEWGPTIAKIVTAVVKVIGKVLEFASAILGKVLPPVIKFAGFLVGTLFAALGVAIGAVIKIIGWIVDFGGAVVKGAQKVNEFANKVDAGIRRVIKFFMDLPGKIKNALSGAGTMLLDIGKNIVQGLANGIESAKQWVIDKIKAVTDSIPGWVKKRLGIASPSRVMKALGRFVAQGLGIGITEGAPAVTDAMDKVSDTITKFYDKRIKKDKKAAAAANGAMRSLRDEVAALKVNTNAQAANTAKLEEANKALEDAIKLRADYAAAVTSAALATGNVVGLGDRESPTGEYTWKSAATVVEDLKGKVVQANEFAGLIKTLTAQGLNQTNLDQLIQSGVEGGLATARALAEGGPGAIAQINSLTTQLQAVATNLGTSTAQTMHGAGVQAAQGLVDGFESMADKLETAGNRLAKKLIKAMRKALKIKSPSRVFREIGQYTTKGLEVGLRDTAGVERATANIGRAMQRSFTQPDLQANAYSSNANAAGTTVNINVTAPPTVDKAALGREITSSIDAYYQAGGRRLAL